MTRPEFPEDIEDLLNRAAPPLKPSESLKADIFAQIQQTPQIPQEPQESEAVGVVKPLRRRLAAPLLTLAAVSALLVGSLTWLSTETSSHQQMDSIMAASDARQSQANAMGAQLDIVVSQSMGKGGAMVDGIPAVGDGMGAQVWAVMADGSMESAGVIGPEPHDDVWMPLPGDTMKVMVTEEPMAGSAQPSGAVLAEVSL
ncbi:anti-sigma factor [Corynebacterium hindlerae]|uniref:Anti-sigma factor n=1 Tax=Corynebacterium hindlerae TaxID=699041 RepID=A0A7G5FCJ2_9CORY|nr:anti-sigma factor [Corynebacterium hindlerae]QMV84333.1 anti-sigma factor [Corynebacterium hindlerae]